jgi:hypothetical protein
MGIYEEATELLKFDPRKENVPGQGAFEEVLKEIETERLEKQKEVARGVLNQLFDLFDKQKKVDQTYNQGKASFEKTAGKLLRRVRNMMNGRPAQEGEKEDQDNNNA